METLPFSFHRIRIESESRLGVRLPGPDRHRNVVLELLKQLWPFGNECVLFFSDHRINEDFELFKHDD